MQDVADTVEFIAGLIIVLAVLFDVFQTVVLPRPTPVTFRPSGRVVQALYWLARRGTLRVPRYREQLLGIFGPLSAVLVLLFWAVGLVAGYGLLLHGVAAQVHPPLQWGTTWYFSATSLFSFGFGDVLPIGGLPRVIVILDAATGLGLFALDITFLFALFGEFQRREVLVVTLSAQAGAPPSGVALLQAYAIDGVNDAMAEDLTALFAAWEVWSAQVLESHLSYPVLAYFRSTHDNQSWVSALGAVLDAATLLLTTVEGVPRRAAQAMYRGGGHLVEDLAQYFRFEAKHDVYVEQSEFNEACERLQAAGYRLRDRELAWQAFMRSRSAYAGALNAMARQWVTPPAQWIGDRSVVPLHQGRVVRP